MTVHAERRCNCNPTARADSRTYPSASPSGAWAASQGGGVKPMSSPKPPEGHGLAIPPRFFGGIRPTSPCPRR
eukprot:4486436-Pyramimonas_sp.AAC.1